MHKGAFRVCLKNITIIVSAILLSSCATQTKNGNAGFQPSNAEIRNPGTIVLPKSFESVWYRAGTRGFSLIAYLASGNLVINDNNIEFESDDESFKINIKDVHSISWGKMSGDTFNDWSIIKYGEPEKIIGFKDGSKLGWGTDTDLYYSTLKYAVEVVAGTRPSTTTNSTHEIDVPGTAANAQLQNDITQKLIEEASKTHGDCGHIVLKADAYKATEPSVIVIEMGGDAPALAKSLRAKGLMFIEKWFLKSCETVNIYEVLLWKSGTGTDIMVKRLDTGE
jgi:hypothetical protein